MPAGQDLIFFDTPEDWSLIANVSKTSRTITENTHEPIKGFDLGVSLNEEYIAVIAGTSGAKSTWHFAGDIAQVYSFSPGAGNPLLGKIQPTRTRLAINRLQLVETNRISTDSFRLKYTPPAWFKNCTIRVYKYTGDKLNFVEDRLFDIGNALGLDPASSEENLTVALAALKTDIEQRFHDLNERIDQDNQAAEQENLELLNQLNQIDAAIYTIAEGIAQLLPPDSGNDLRQSTQQRLDLDLGFL